MADRNDFYREKAAECEDRARATSNPVQRDQWLKMAADWRTMLRDDRPKSADEN